MALDFIEALRLPRTPSRSAGAFRIAGGATLVAMRGQEAELMGEGFVLFDEAAGVSLGGMLRFRPSTLVFRHGSLPEDGVRDVALALDSSCNVVVISDEPAEAVKAYYRDRIDVVPTP